MKRLSLIFVFFVSFVTHIFSLTDEEIKKNINTIKSDPETYLYVQANGTSQNNARNEARTQLNHSIEQWVKETIPNINIDVVIAKKIEECSQEISLKYGANYYKAFAYVKKQDIYALLPISDISQTLNMQQEITPNSSDKDNQHENKTGVEYTDSITFILTDCTPDKNLDECDLIKRICSLSTISQVKHIINESPYKGNYYYRYVRSTNDSKRIKTDGTVLIIYQNDTIKSFMKWDGTSFINLKTWKKDNLANYPEGNAIYISKTNL